MIHMYTRLGNLFLRIRATKKQLSTKQPRHGKERYNYSHCSVKHDSKVQNYRQIEHKCHSHDTSVADRRM